MTLTLPAEGEMMGPLAQNPGPLKVFRFTAGIGGDVVLGATGVVQAVTVPIGTMIHDVHHRVITAFTSATTLTIGDDEAVSGDVDGYATDTLIDPQTAVTTGIYVSMVATGTVGYAGGHMYLIEDTIDIVVAGTAALAGLLEIVLVYSEAAADS